LAGQVNHHTLSHRAGVQGVNACSAFDISRVIRRIINYGIIAVPTVDGIITRAAIQSVVSGPAADKVRQAVADQAIVAAAAQYIFKVSVFFY